VKAPKEDAVQSAMAQNASCTCVIHEAVPTVLSPPPVIDSPQLIIPLPPSPAQLPLAVHPNHGVRFFCDTGPPGADLVVTLHRLVI
jgi:hypothetical protein